MRGVRELEVRFRKSSSRRFFIRTLVKFVSKRRERREKKSQKYFRRNRPRTFPFPVRVSSSQARQKLLLLLLLLRTFSERKFFNELLCSSQTCVMWFYFYVCLEKSWIFFGDSLGKCFLYQIYFEYIYIVTFVY